MTELSTRLASKPRRRSLVRRLRQLLDYIDAVDLEEIGRLIAKFQANQARTQDSQSLLIQFLRTHSTVPFIPPLISPIEFATGNRYELENRCRAMTNPLYIGDDTALCRMLGSYKLFVDTRDTGFGCHVVLDGYWEPWITIFVARQLQPGMTVIDVGANYGYYSLLFGALVGETGHVYAIEPNPAIVAKLERSIALNGLAKRTTLVRAAAGANARPEVVLYAPHGEPKNSMIIAAAEHAPAELGTVYKVPQITLDEVVGEAAHVDFVKIDAEGAEEAVIDGMSGMLARDKPDLLLEFNAARYADARGFVDRVAAHYSRMQFIDFDGNAVPASVDDVLGRRWGEDWMLFFDSPEELNDRAQ